MKKSIYEAPFCEQSVLEMQRVIATSSTSAIPALEEGTVPADLWD